MNDTPGSIIIKMLTPLKPIPPEIETRSDVLKNIKAVLFDIYGTLLISGTGDISLSALQRDTLDMDLILNESGFKTSFRGCSEVIPEILNRKVKDYHKDQKLSGVDYPEVDIRDIWKKTLEELWKEGLLAEDPGDNSVDLLSLRHELSVNPVWPMPGFPEIIQSLKKTGLHVGIVSNAQFYTPLIIEALANLTLEQIGFEGNLCTWSYEIHRAKPSAEIFKGPITQLEDIGIKPDEILYVGNDMLNDVNTASAAGCRTALFAGDRRSLRMRDGDDRIRYKPDIIITDLLQLEPLLSFKG